jgi:hypothetical protein
VTVGDALRNQGAVLSQAPLTREDDIVLGPTAAGTETFPPLPRQSAEAMYLDEAAGAWIPFTPGNYEARTIYSENTMGFRSFSHERRYAFLAGPSGSGSGHRWNEGGFDGVVFNLEGPLRLLFPDEKATTGTVRSATALTKNWRQNVEALQQELADPRFDSVPRIDEVRQVLDVTVQHARRDLAPPQEVGRMITRYGDAAPVGRTLAQRLTSSGTPALTPGEMPEAVAPAGRLVETREPAALLAPSALPVSKSAAVAEGVAGAAAMWIGPVLDKLNEIGLAHRVSNAIDEITKSSSVDAFRKQNPDQGVLIVVQLEVSENVIDPDIPHSGAEFLSAFPALGGTTMQEAVQGFQSQAQLTRGPDKGYRLLPDEFHWLPPLGSPQPQPSPNPT